MEEITEKNIIKILSDFAHKNTLGKYYPIAFLVNPTVFQIYASKLESIALRQKKWRGYHMWVNKEYMDKGYDNLLFHRIPVCNAPAQEESITVLLSEGPKE